MSKLKELNLSDIGANISLKDSQHLSPLNLNFEVDRNEENNLDLLNQNLMNSSNLPPENEINNKNLNFKIIEYEAVTFANNESFSPNNSVHQSIFNSNCNIPAIKNANLLSLEQAKQSNIQLNPTSPFNRLNEESLKEMQAKIDALEIELESANKKLKLQEKKKNIQTEENKDKHPGNRFTSGHKEIDQNQTFTEKIKIYKEQIVQNDELIEKMRLIMLEKDKTIEKLLQKIDDLTDIIQNSKISQTTGENLKMKPLNKTLFRGKSHDQDQPLVSTGSNNKIRYHKEENYGLVSFVSSPKQENYDEISRARNLSGGRDIIKKTDGDQNSIKNSQISQKRDLLNSRKKSLTSTISPQKKSSREFGASKDIMLRISQQKLDNTLNKPKEFHQSQLILSQSKISNANHQAQNLGLMGLNHTTLSANKSQQNGISKFKMKNKEDQHLIKKKK